jgi:hypothetical protein
MSDKLTSDDIINSITQGCQRAAKAKVRQEISVIKKENVRLKRELAVERKKRDPYSDRMKKLEEREKNTTNREMKVKSAATELADTYKYLEKVKSLTVTQFIDKMRGGRDWWSFEERSKAIRDVRSWVGKKGVVPKKKTTRKKK